MDPTKMPNLDPKLKEAYERVMGTPIPQAPATQAAPPQPAAQPTTNTTDQLPAAPTASPTPPPAPTPSPMQSPAMPEPVSPPAAPEPPAPPVMPQPEPLAEAAPAPQAPMPVEPVEEPMTPTSMSQSPVEPVMAQPDGKVELNAQQPFVATQNAAPGDSKKISPVILAVAGVVFFLVYGLFWVKVFNIKLPFLP